MALHTKWGHNEKSKATFMYIGENVSLISTAEVALAFNTNLEPWMGSPYQAKDKGNLKLKNSLA